METIEESSVSESNVTRRSLLRVVGLGAVVTAASAALAGCGGGSSSGTSTSDQAILTASAAAEALSATFYANLISSSLYSQLAGKPFDQAFFVAAYQQEVAHYQLLTTTNGGTPLATNQNFYFPTGTFQTSQATINTLEIVEDLLIATYLFGVNNFSSGTFRLQAAQMLGVQSEHRALARVAANDLGLPSTGNLAGGTENLGGGNAANNYVYERLFPNQISSLSSITTILTNNFQTIGAGGYSQTAYPINVTGTLTGIVAVNQDNTVITN